MANINLLPEDLRKDEEKELKKSAKNKRFVVDMNMPSDGRSASLDESIEQPSFWEKIFGTPNIPRPEKTHNKTFAPAPMTVSGASSQVARPTTKVEEKWPKKFFGKPASLINDNYSDKLPKASEQGSSASMRQRGSMSWNYKSQPASNSGPVSSTVQQNVYNPVRLPNTQYPQRPSSDKNPAISPSFFVEKPKRSNNVVSQKGDGWWGIIKSLFFPKHKDWNVKMASDGNDVNRMRQMVEEDLRQENKIKQVNNYNKAVLEPKPKKEKPAQAPKQDKSLQNKYHLAPKSEKADFDINLIPEELVFQSQPNYLSKVVSLLLIVLVAIGIVAGIYYFIDYQQTKLSDKVAQISQENLMLAKDLAVYKKIEQQNNQSAKKVMAIGNLLQNHIYWTKFFNSLEKYTLDGVYYSSFSADTSGAIALPASAKDYPTAVKQIAALNQAKEFVTEAKVNSMQMSVDEKRGVTSISFEIKVILNKDTFKTSNGQGN